MKRPGKIIISGQTWELRKVQREYGGWQLSQPYVVWYQELGRWHTMKFFSEENDAKSWVAAKIRIGLFKGQPSQG